MAVETSSDAVRLTFGVVGLCGALLIASGLAFFVSGSLTISLAVCAAAAGALATGFFFGRFGQKAIANTNGRLAAATATTTTTIIDPQPALRSNSLIATAAADTVVMAGALLEATMDSMHEGVLVLDNGMRVIAANQAAHDIFLTKGEPLLAKRLSELTRNPSIHNAFLGALERGERTEVKVETHTADRRVFDLRVAPLKRPRVERETEHHHYEEAMVVHGAVGAFFDITRLERLERVRQEFFANMSHELRTPLTAVLTFVETLEEGAVDDAAHNRRFLSVIRRNAERMHSLINDILEISAIEAGAVRVQPRPVRLRPLVSDVLTVLAAQAAERAVELRNEVDADAVVYADAHRLEQMLNNLVNNAIKFNREGGSVTVTHHEQAAHHQIAVTDTGEGIAPEHISRIFERFYRVDRARARTIGGTGLGLAIVKHLARAHRGEAVVASTPGQGSVFTIELPFVSQK